MTTRAILAGLALGALTGVFLGEHAAVFDDVADGFVKLLQMTVLPLIVVSLMAGIGSLTAEQVRSLGLRTGLLLAGLWVAGIAIAFLFPVMFPETVSASFFSTTLVEPREPFNFVDLYIPANPFRSLADNVVPAVVLFSVMVGIALIGISGRERLLDILVLMRQALARATTFIVRLTPYGLFAIAANAAGTLTIEQLERVQVYLAAYVAMSLLVTLWVLPGLVSALTPIPYRAVLRTTHNSLITAFTTSSLFIVLPMLIDEAKALAREYNIAAPLQGTADVIVPASFNFPHIGKVMTLSFVLFAGWFAGAPLDPAEYPQLAATGVFVLFGSVNVAVPFLLDLFRIPADTFQLFLATSVINSRFGTLMAAMHTVTVAVLGTFLLAGAVTLTPRRLLRYAVVTLALAAVTIAGVRAVVGTSGAYQGDQLLLGMGMLDERGDALVLDGLPRDSRPADGNALAYVRTRGTLRVGIVPDSLPFAFTNSAGQLVGFDVEMAYKLARELSVGLEFVQVARPGIAEALKNGWCDIVMSGVVVATERAAAMPLSKPYLDETLAFVVPDHARAEFATWAQARQLGAIRVGSPALTNFRAKVHAELPEAEIVPFTSAHEVLDNSHLAVDAVVLTAERGSAWTLLHPELTVVVPMPRPVRVPLAYPVADTPMAAFVDAWIDLARKDGTIQALYEHWILGRTATAAAPRWSIIRNVLHWVE